ncbi:hypothetical protein JG688_00017567, partial [Phytophthora aleatoria]
MGGIPAPNTPSLVQEVLTCRPLSVLHTRHLFAILACAKRPSGWTRPSTSLSSDYRPLIPRLLPICGFCREAPVLRPTIVMEYQMAMLYQQLKGAANVHTMDDRGTGRSTFLDCAATQAITSGSPRGKSMDPSEVPSCAQALEDKYGDLASFSTTSAAKDL